MKTGNTTLIPQNIAPPNAQKMAVFDSNDNLVCEMTLGHLAMPNVGTKKYSVGLLADTHTREEKYDTDYGYSADSVADLTEAIRYFSTVAEITCVCGDLAQYREALWKHKEIVDANRGAMEVLEIAGNHEHQSYPTGTESIMTDDEIRQYTGHPLHYAVERHGDVFIMCGAVRYRSVFDQASIQWLYETLEANRNKRCFLFLHPPLEGPQYCGDSTDVLTWDMITNYKDTFVAMLRHYKNVIYFHGHTHGMLQMQEYTQKLDPPLPANYDKENGIHSVHIPSLAVPRDITTGARVDVPGESQGYLMDVYENHVVLRGMDFARGEFIPIANYCLDTTLQTVEAGTFTDSAGVIVTV